MNFLIEHSTTVTIQPSWSQCARVCTKNEVKNIDFWPRLLQPLDFEFWPTCSDQIFLKLKWYRFSKKKKSTGCNRVFDQVAGSIRQVTPGFFFSYFFFNMYRFQSQVNLLDWISKIWLKIFKPGGIIYTDYMYRQSFTILFSYSNFFLYAVNSFMYWIQILPGYC